MVNLDNERYMEDHHNHFLGIIEDRTSLKTHTMEIIQIHDKREHLTLLVMVM